MVELAQIDPQQLRPDEREGILLELIGVVAAGGTKTNVLARPLSGVRKLRPDQREAILRELEAGVKANAVVAAANAVVRARELRGDDLEPEERPRREERARRTIAQGKKIWRAARALTDYLLGRPTPRPPR